MGAGAGANAGAAGHYSRWRAPAFSSSASSSSSEERLGLGLDGKYEHLQVSAFSEDGKVALVSMDRPRLHNAFNAALIAELTDVFAKAGQRQHQGEHRDSSSDSPTSSDALLDGAVAVVLTGNGKSFSAGADLAWMKSLGGASKEENARDAHLLYDLFRTIEDCPIPTIARVNGRALGGGVGLVSACDIALCVDMGNHDQFGLTEVRLGLVPAVISPFVVRKIGRTAASRYCLTGDRFGAREALRMGLIAGLFVSVEELDAEVEKIVGSVQLSGPEAVRRCKQLLRDVTVGTGQFVDTADDDVKHHLANEIASARSSDEGRDGLAAFLNKEKAPWIQ